MIYSTNNILLATFLLTKRNFKYFKIDVIDNDPSFQIEYKNEKTLAKHLKDYLNFNAKVNFEKYKEVRNFLEEELESFK